MCPWTSASPSAFSSSRNRRRRPLPHFLLGLDLLLGALGRRSVIDDLSNPPHASQVLRITAGSDPSPTPLAYQDGVRGRQPHRRPAGPATRPSGCAATGS